MKTKVKMGHMKEKRQETCTQVNKLSENQTICKIAVKIYLPLVSLLVPLIDLLPTKHECSAFA